MKKSVTYNDPLISERETGCYLINFNYKENYR